MQNPEPESRTFDVQGQFVFPSLRLLRVCLHPQSDGKQKGLFPHFLNTEAHQEYVGPWPKARYYDPDGMKPHMRKDFGTWYQTVQHREFNLH